MYLTKKLGVGYIGVTSRCVSVSNKVKQGGVLSPTHFGVYVDGMLEKHKESGYPFKVGSKYCGDVGFADGLFFINPYSIGLKKIL